MRIYASWYAGDPEYQLIDKNCHILISPTSVSRKWNIKKFTIKPMSIMIDSGSFHFINVDKNKLKVSQKEMFERQIKILDGFKKAIICHLDFPIPRKGLSIDQMKERVEITIENAQIFYDLCLKYSRKLCGIKPLAVIQGYDIDSILYCVKKLKSIGYKRFGIGSVAYLSRLNRNEIIRRIVSVFRFVRNLHVFGVSSIELMRTLKKFGVMSVDSATPVKEAVFSGILYSNPFRRFKIATEHFAYDWSKKYGYAKPLNRPLPCKCPVCKNIGSWVLMRRGKKIWNNLRALHNYYHLKKEILGKFEERDNVNLFIKNIHSFNKATVAKT